MNPSSSNDETPNGNISSQLASMSLNRSSPSRFTLAAKNRPLIPDEELARAVAAGGRLGLRSHAYLLPDRKTVVKQGTSRLGSEAKTMRTVRKYTSIPVPEVYEVRYDDDNNEEAGRDGDAQMLMEYVEGQSLEQAWALYTAEEKASVVAQLRGYLAELASKEAPFVGAVDGTPVRDGFFECVPHRAYGAERDFNRGLLRAWWLNTKERDDRDAHVQFLHALVHMELRGHKMVMTWNNMHPRNILVRGTRIVALLDWSQAGYLPEYWEYCRPWGRCWESCGAEESFMTNETERVLDQILTPYEEELKVFEYRFANLETKYHFNPRERRREFDVSKGIYVW
ncbi:hypothetical protein Hte_002761 [Hypoxylon texense]